MNVNKLSMVFNIITRAEMSPEIIEEFQEEIDSYKYPLGAFPIDFLASGINALTDFTYNLDYISKLIAQLYINYYTEDDMNIISIYIAMRMSSHNLKMFSTLKSLLNVTSDKLEIQYCLEELKYTYVEMAIENRMDFDLIPTLLNDLREIEEIHNNFSLQEQINGTR